MLANGTFTRDIPDLPSLDSSAMAPTQKRGVYPIFFMDPVLDKVESDKAGRPIYREVEKVRIMIAGDAKSEVVQKVTNRHRMDFPGAYQRFKAGVEQVPDGTPLEQWPQISRSQALTFRAANIHSVEMLAEVSDTALQSLGMGARELRAKARAYIERAASTAAADKQAAENAALKEQIALLTSQIADMQARFGDDDGTPAKRGPGRPPKIKED